MLYLLFVLTFLAGILFYGLSPHDKQLDMSAHQAEGMIITFLAQHQAGKDYLYTWLGGSNAEDTGNLQSSPNNNFLKVDAPVFGVDAPVFGFEQMMPKGVTHVDMCGGNNGTPGENTCQDSEGEQQIPGFVSRVFCLDASGNIVQNCENASVKKRYLATYGGWEECTRAEAAQGTCTLPYKRPSWWPRPGQKMRRFESWRQAIANRTRGSISCGTLTLTNGNETCPGDPIWCIDNGKSIYKNESARDKTCMNQVPNAIVNELPYQDCTENAERECICPGRDDLLFCLSEIKQGLGYYVGGADYFYDGFSNIGIGKHDKGDSVNWVNLISSGDTIDSKFELDVPGSTKKKLTTAIPVDSSQYTITVLAKVKTSEDVTFPLFTGKSGGDDFSVFQWERPCSDGGDNEGCFHAQTNGANVYMTTTNRGIISWTFVVDTCSEDNEEKGYTKSDTCISFYENAVKRGMEKKASFNGTLSIGIDEVGDKVTIYGIRHYSSALGPKQIQKNFKVDQKRFGISDDNNGGLDELRSTTDIDYRWQP